MIKFYKIFLFILISFFSTSLVAQDDLIEGNNELEDKSYLKKDNPAPVPQGLQSDQEEIIQVILNDVELNISNEIKSENQNVNNNKLKVNTLNNILIDIKPITELNLYNKGLTSFPMEILSFTELEILNLSFNQIEVIPEEIGNLKKLKILYLNHNQLSTLPESIGSLVHLEELMIERNNENFVLPDTIQHLIKLKRIWLSDLNKLPEGFWKLVNLEDAKLWSSNIQEIPSDIKKFKNLKEICLRDNKLTSLPDEIFKLKHLTYLSLGNNQFSSMSNKVNKLKNIDYLGLFGNPISEIPLTPKTIQTLNWLAVWDTNLPNSFTNKILSISPTTKVNQTGEGIH